VDQHQPMGARDHRARTVPGIRYDRDSTFESPMQSTPQLPLTKADRHTLSAALHVLRYVIKDPRRGPAIAQLPQFRELGVPTVDQIDALIRTTETI
jgi:hypothetical protein